MPHRAIILKLTELADELAPANPKVKAIILDLAVLIGDAAEQYSSHEIELEERLINSTTDQVRALRELVTDKVHRLTTQQADNQSETRNKLHSLANYLMSVENKLAELAELLTTDEGDQSE